MRLKDIVFYEVLHDKNNWGELEQDGGVIWIKDQDGLTIAEELDFHEALHKILINNSHIIKLYNYSKATYYPKYGLLTIPI